MEARKLLDSATGNLTIIKEKYKLAQQQGKIDNLVGWMIKAIKDNYKKQVNKKLILLIVMNNGFIILMIWRKNCLDGRIIIKTIAMKLP